MTPLRVRTWRRIRQRIRYWNYWPVHPIEYSRSERMRRALNTLASEFDHDDHRHSIWFDADEHDVELLISPVFRGLDGPQ